MIWIYGAMVMCIILLLSLIYGIFWSLSEMKNSSDGMKQTLRAGLVLIAISIFFVLGVLYFLIKNWSFFEVW